MALKRRPLPGVRKGGRPRRYGGDEMGRGFDLAAGPRSGSTWGSAQPRDLMQQLDADQANRSWRQGLTLAFTSIDTIAQQTRFAEVFALEPFAGNDPVDQSAALIGFPSKASPQGRWTVTVNPRSGPVAPQALDVDDRVEILAVINGVERRFLRVRATAVTGEGATNAVRGIVGELVEDSLIIEPGDVRSYAPDDEVTVMLVSAVSPDGGFLYLDGRFKWKRERQENGKFILRRFRIPPDIPLWLTDGRWVVRSTAYSCNCPAYSGMEVQDWRPRDGALGARRFSPYGSAQAPAGADTFDAVARRFASTAWYREPLQSCKHVHASRFLTGCPLSEPGDANSPVNSYWSDPDVMAKAEEFVSPLQQPEYMSWLQRRNWNDSMWQDLDAILPTISVGDAFSVLPETVGLLQVLAADPGIADLVGDPETLEAINIIEAGAPLPASFNRFCRIWPVVRPRDVREDARSGDVWSGSGNSTEAFVFTSATDLADKPLVSPLDAPVVIPP
jgi:hypothetical protein